MIQLSLLKSPKIWVPKEPPLLTQKRLFIHFQPLGLIPRLHVDFPKFNGPACCSGRDLRSMSRLVGSVMPSGSLSQHSFAFFFVIFSRDLMSSVATLFFAVFLCWLLRLGNLIVCFYLCFLRIIMLQSRLELFCCDHV